MTRTDQVNQFQAIYNAHFPAEVQPLLVQQPGQQTSFLGENSDERAALCAALEAKGFAVDQTTMGWGWGALNAMSDRSNFGISSAYGYPTVFVDWDDWEGTLAHLRKLYPSLAPPPPPSTARSPVGDPTGAEPVNGKYSYFANIPESYAFEGRPEGYQGYTLKVTRGLMGNAYKWIK